MFLGWIDKISQGSVSSAETLAELPVQNLQVNPVGRIARATATAMTIDMDFGSTTAWRVFGLIGVNLNASATVRYRLSAVAAGGAEVYDSGAVNAGIVAGFAEAWHVLSSAMTARYVRLDIDTTASPQASIDIGRFAGYGGGGFWEPSKNRRFLRQWRVGDDSEIQQSMGGQDLARAGPKRRHLDFTLGFMTRTEMFDNALAADLAAGRIGDLLVMLDPTLEPVRETVWGPQREMQPLINISPSREAKRFIVTQRL